MKDYSKILEEQKGRIDSKKSVVIEQRWGETPASIYNQIVPRYNELPFGVPEGDVPDGSKNDAGSIYVVSNKKFGFKTLVGFLKERGLELDIVGKGKNDARMIQIDKRVPNPERLAEYVANNKAHFEYRGNKYEVQVGNAVFSKSGLDDGTRFLLDVFLSQDAQSKDLRICDVGSGWGAISIVLARELGQASVVVNDTKAESKKSDVEIIAIEREDGAYRALEENINNPISSQVNVDGLPRPEMIRAYHADFLDAHDQNLKNLSEKSRKFDYIISNFSFHISKEEQKKFFERSAAILKPEGEMFFVTEGRFRERFEHASSELFTIEQVFEKGRYKVFQTIVKK